MHELDLNENDVHALVLTHEHSDHVSGVSVWVKRWEGPLFASQGTPDARKYLACLPFETFGPGEEFEVAGVRVQTFPTTHDVVNPVGFRFSCQGDAIGYATDTGTLPPGAMSLLHDARILAIESNHDVPMLRTGSYPRHLQDRIISELGHLSNEQAAGALRELVTDRTEHVVAMHISQENNRPSLAVRALAAAVNAKLDNELGPTATLERSEGLPALRIRAAGRTAPSASSDGRLGKVARRRRGHDGGDRHHARCQPCPDANPAPAPALTIALDPPKHRPRRWRLPSVDAGSA